MIINDEEIFIADYFDNKSKKILYAPLRQSVFLVDKKIAEKIDTNINDNDIVCLTEYLKDKEKIDVSKVLELQQNEAPDLSISLTNNCNLGCIYCHANAGTVDNSESTNVDNITQIIDYFFDVKLKSYKKLDTVQLGFMGSGEPTVEFDLMKYAIKYAKKKAEKQGLKLYIVTATNGFFNKSVADFIIKEFSHLSYSFDGPDFIQNFQRPTKNQKESYLKVFENAKYIYESDLSISFRATVSKITIHHYKEFIDFFATNFPGSYLGLEPLSKFGRGKDSEIAPSKEEFFNFIRMVTEYANGKSIVLKNSSVEKLTFLRTVFCKAISSPSFTINPNGQIWSCARENAPEIFKYGQFDFKNKVVKIDNEKVKNLKKFNVFNFEECTDCIAKYHCAGDCPDYRMENLLKCDTTKMLTVNMLNKIIKPN